MCGRFALTLPHDAMARLFAAAPDASLTAALGNLGPRWNVCPTTQIPAVVSCGATAEGPWSDRPVSDRPVSDGPVSDGPVSDGPVSDGPVSDGPRSVGPVSDRPRSVGPAAEGEASRGGASGDRPRRLTALRWGLIPRWAKAPSDGPLLINARAETVAEKPAFREAARARRCLVPADGFYEWLREGREKRPHWVHPAAGGIVALAGIWEVWRGPNGEEIPACALITAAAGPPVDAIHHRTPVAIAPEDWALWLGEAGHGAARLMRAAPEGFWAMHPVSPAVNSNRAEGEALITPWSGPPPSG